MKAVVLRGINNLELTDVPNPEKAAPEHLIIEMHTCGINSGDKLFISGAFPRGIPASKYDIAGVSGVGKVVDVGAGAPGYYQNQNVVMYRSLKSSDETIGTWSEYSHLHYLNCAVVPEKADLELYSGSLVNMITPHVFLKHVKQEGHKAMICTAGNSATGIVMLGMCHAQKFPIISIVRTEKGKKELEAMGAEHILVQSDPDFREQLQQTAEKLDATVVFDGVGGSTLSSIVDILPFNSIIYCYGFLEKEIPFSFHTTTLMRGIVIRGFSNFRTETARDPAQLEKALQDITTIIDQPYFQTKIGKHFSFDEASEAIRFSSKDGGKAVLTVVG